MALFNFLEQVDMAIQPKRWWPLSRHPILQFGRMKARSESAENRVQRNRRNRRNRRKGRNGFNIQGPVPIVASPFPRVPGITNTSTFTRRNGSSSVITLVARNPTRGRWICRTIRRFTLRWSLFGVWPAPAVGRPSRGNAIWWTMWSLLTMASPVRPAVFAFARSPSLRTTGSWCTPML